MRRVLLLVIPLCCSCSSLFFVKSWEANNTQEWKKKKEIIHMLGTAPNISYVIEKSNKKLSVYCPDVEGMWFYGPPVVPFIPLGLINKNKNDTNFYIAIRPNSNNFAIIPDSIKFVYNNKPIIPIKINKSNYGGEYYFGFDFDFAKSKLEKKDEITIIFNSCLFEDVPIPNLSMTFRKKIRYVPLHYAAH